MIYCYQCLDCKRSFDVVKLVKDIDRNETCPRCGEFATREFAPQRIHLSKTKVTHAEYNPGLNAVVKNERHKDYLLKEKGVVEIGNDFGSGTKMQKEFTTAREKKLAKAWED